MLIKKKFLPAALALGVAAGSLALPSASHAQGGKPKRAAPEAQAAVNFDGIIAETVELIGKNELIPALSMARKAVQARPVNYKAHYYVAFVLFRMGNWDMADDAVRETLRFSTDDVRDDVLKLQQAIAWGRASSQAATDAVAAQEEGLNGKAAALFKQAWEAGYQQPENAFSAAQLFSTRLSQPVAAGKLLREVLAKSADPDTAARAQTELSKLQAQLSGIAAARLKAAEGASGQPQQQLLTEALDADPDHLPAHALRARLAAQAGDITALKGVLQGLSRRNKLDPAMLKGEEYSALVKDAAFAAWLNDLMGGAAVQQLLADIAELDRIRAAKARYAEQKAEYETQLRQYQSTLAEHKKFTPCVNQARTAHQRCEATIPALDTGFLGIGSNADTVAAMRVACQGQLQTNVNQCRATYPEQAPAAPVAPAAPAS